MDFGEFFEQGTVAPAFGPVDLHTANNPGAWVSMKGYNRLAIVFIKGVGTAGDDPVITVNQAQDLSGTGSKALTFARVRVNQGGPTIPAGQGFSLIVRDNTGNVEAGATMVNAAPTNSFTLTGGAVDHALVGIDIHAAHLDVQNGFSTVQVSVAQAATATQLGVAYYVLFQAREAQQNMDAAQ